MWEIFSWNRLLDLDKSPLDPLSKGETLAPVFDSPPLTKGGRGDFLYYKSVPNANILTVTVE